MTGTTPTGAGAGRQLHVMVKPTGAGCPKDRFTTAPNAESGPHYLCPGYQAFFHHVCGPMTATARLLREGRAPSELMTVCARDDANRGRTEPCTCGSAKKWKKCHGSGAR